LPERFGEARVRCRPSILRDAQPVWNPAGMFLRHKTRDKDRKQHRYWSIVETRRVGGGRTAQRHVLYPGEINDPQKAAWCQTVQAFDEGRRPRQIALLPKSTMGSRNWSAGSEAGDARGTIKNVTRR